jgi:hypothetical protein
MIQDIKDKFSVEKVGNNGYRCSCHTYNYASTIEFFDTLPEAMLQFPIAIPGGLTDYPEEEYGDNYDIMWCKVRNPAGEIVAFGQLSWKGVRSELYRNTKWSGYILGNNFKVTEGPLWL